MALTDSIQAYWKLDETGTGNAADATGGGNTLINNGPWTYATAKINNGFDGGSTNTTKYGKVASALGMDGTTFMTFNFWMNVTTQPGSGTVSTPLRWEQSAGSNRMNYEFQLFNNSGTLECYLRRNDSVGADQYGVAQTFTAGTWFMLTITWDGSTVDLYVNANSTPVVTGGSTRTGTGSDPTAAGTFFEIGADDVNSRFLSGLMDEVGAWSRVLSSSEITELYNGGNGLQYPFAAAVSLRDARNFTLLGVG